MRRVLTVLAAILAAVLSWSPASADDDGYKDDGYKNAMWSAGLTAGTLGPGGQASFLLYKVVVVRLEGSYLSVPTEGLTVSLQSAGAILDLHPFENAFRVSGGIRYFEYDISGITTVNEASGPNRFRIEATNSNQAAPYLGFGLDTSHFSGGKYEFKLGLDLGVIYSGKPDVSANNLTNPGEDVQSQINSVIGKYQVLDLYPVATISARINF